MLRLLFSENTFSRSGYTIEEVMENLRKGAIFLDEIRSVLNKVIDRKVEGTNNYFLLLIEKLRELRRATYKQLFRGNRKGSLRARKGT
ncbi:MAG: hypothetical protein QXG44_07865 [Candidatus Jordarchaeaceae archaeon]